ncbi:hypothetical protein [Saccharopolyspora hordei]|uniref:Uncharacterized protein n=1 Tax=Saccharopolyspora hordei TaxID=1838 RepID=A0A853AGF8_9PSEU|nr:hypothetical protein [Saccharopolyspora hordei]NYI83058.1 hypothetical protein [Saccharopolyspora hordei]
MRVRLGQAPRGEGPLELGRRLLVARDAHQLLPHVVVRRHVGHRQPARAPAPTISPVVASNTSCPATRAAQTSGTTGNISP